MFNVYLPKLLESRLGHAETGGRKRALWDVVIFTLGGCPGAIVSIIPFIEHFLRILTRRQYMLSLPPCLRPLCSSPVWRVVPTARCLYDRYATWSQTLSGVGHVPHRSILRWVLPSDDTIRSVTDVHLNITCRYGEFSISNEFQEC